MKREEYAIYVRVDPETVAGVLADHPSFNRTQAVLYCLENNLGGAEARGSGDSWSRWSYPPGGPGGP